MFKHVVMMKFKEPNAKREAEIVKEKLMDLLGKVESLRSMEVGLDAINSQRSYDLCLIATFDDMAGYKAYDAHPSHEAVRGYVKGVRESSAAVDFEC